MPSDISAVGKAATCKKLVCIPKVVRATGMTAVNEIIKDGVNGILCEDGVAPFSEALKKLMENEMLRKKFGENAKTSVSAYAPEKVWQAWEDLLQQLLQDV